MVRRIGVNQIRVSAKRLREFAAKCEPWVITEKGNPIAAMVPYDLYISLQNIANASVALAAATAMPPEKLKNPVE